MRGMLPRTAGLPQLATSAALALLVVALAGCSDGGPGGVDGGDAVDGATSASLPTPSAPVEPPAPRQVVTNVTLDGQTATAACAGVDTSGHCQILQQPESSWTEFSTLGLPGTPVRVQATFTWTPVAEQAPDLRVYVFSLAAEGPPVDGVEVTGDSPLAVDVDLAGLEPGVGYAISVHSHTEAGAGGAMAIAEASQPFHAELAITSLVAVA